MTTGSQQTGKRLSIWERIDRWIKRLVTGRRDV